MSSENLVLQSNGQSAIVLVATEEELRQLSHIVAVKLAAYTQAKTNLDAANAALDAAREKAAASSRTADEKAAAVKVETDARAVLSDNLRLANETLEAALAHLADCKTQAEIDAANELIRGIRETIESLNTAITAANASVQAAVAALLAATLVAMEDSNAVYAAIEAQGTANTALDKAVGELLSAQRDFENAQNQ